LVEYLSGNRIQGSSALITTPTQNSWEEITRGTIASGNTADSFSFTSLSTSAYSDLMLIINLHGNGSEITYGMKFNNITGDGRYPMRRNNNGATDGEYTSTYDHFYNGYGGTNSDRFAVYYINNIDGGEKFVTGRQIVNVDRGNQSAVPDRNSFAGKFNDATNSNVVISQIDISGNFDSNQAGNYVVGSEAILLGAKKTGTNTSDNFFQKIKQETLGSDADSFDISFTPKKYMWFEANIKSTNTTQWEMKFGDSGSVNSANSCSTRMSKHTGSNNSSVSDTTDRTSQDSYESEFSDAFDKHVQGWILNDATSRDPRCSKLIMADMVTAGGSNGGTAPKWIEMYGKWSETPQINFIQWVNTQAASGSFGAGSTMTIWGAD
jgi:hypothetical protein